MRKYFLLVLLVIFCFGFRSPHLRVVAIKNASSCDDCTGATQFAFHMEDNDSTPDVTLGTPCGCSDGDTIGAETGSPAFSAVQASDGTYSLHIDAFNEYYEYDINANDIINPADFKIIFDIYVVSMPSDDQWKRFEILGAAGDADDYVSLYLEDRGATEEITGAVNCQGTEETINVVITTGAWKTSCEWQFKDGVAGNDHYLSCDGNTREDDDDPTTFGTTPTTLYFGDERGTEVEEYYLDNVKITASDRW